MLKQASNYVFSRSNTSTCSGSTPRCSILPAALLDDLFEHPG